MVSGNDFPETHASLLIVIGIRLLSNSSMAISTGSMNEAGTSMITGAPMDTCKALAPIILAFSNLVYGDITINQNRKVMKPNILNLHGLFV